MCGRYTLTDPSSALERLFGVEESALDPAFDLSPRFNVAPSQEMPVVRVETTAGERGRAIGVLRWGLVPFWADDPSIGNRMINARSETVAEKPAFRVAFRQRRCLVPADGFYEWKKTPGGKQPHLVRRAGGEPFAFAGLWERWEKSEGEPLETFVLMTTAPRGVVAELHDRMPVILPESRFDAWLDPERSEPEELVRILESTDGAELEAHPVSTYVNSPANDDPRCVEPLSS